ncbi:MAG: sporulation protein YabP [Lachnospiraceae bacterium]|nr:sporulation protein YabP [Lachnospiraceae bacterium]
MDVISFDLSAITLETICGVMNVKGNDLKVNSVKLEEGEVEAQGCVDSVVYSELSSLKSKGKSVVKRMFG